MYLHFGSCATEMFIHKTMTLNCVHTLYECMCFRLIQNKSQKWSRNEKVDANVVVVWKWNRKMENRLSLFTLCVCVFGCLFLNDFLPTAIEFKVQRNYLLSSRYNFFFLFFSTSVGRRLSLCCFYSINWFNRITFHQYQVNEMSSDFKGNKNAHRNSSAKRRNEKAIK